MQLLVAQAVEAGFPAEPPPVLEGSRVLPPTLPLPLRMWQRGSPSLLLAGIANPKQAKDAPKSFTFDYSYWSHTSVSVAAGRRLRLGLSCVWVPPSLDGASRVRHPT